MSAPSNDDAAAVDDHVAFIESLAHAANALERFVKQIASGQYYRKHSGSFNQKSAVDSRLLDDLAAVGDCLCRDGTAVERKRVHSLLGRIVFTCYLVDRGIIDLQDYPFIRRKNVLKLVDLLREYDPARAKELLYKLFAQLRKDFNGSMFDEDLDAEQKHVTDANVVWLRKFLQGESLQSGQQSFGFWAYDFSVVPVETISAIYEKFLEDEDADGKKSAGAFYTPKHLAEAVVDEATGTLDTLLDKKCLDPACGSGIFLVVLFNRIAEEWNRKNPKASFARKEAKFRQVLTGQLVGVDINKTACRITCFSLYVAFLDQFSPQSLRDFLKKTKRKVLPSLLAYQDERYKNTETPAVFEGNFFETMLPIADSFNIVVGNPPWVGRNQQADKKAVDWIFGKHNPYLSDAPKAFAKRQAIFLPQRQIAHAFMWKAPCSVNETGRIALLLPSEVLLNQTDEFQKAWFGRFHVERVLHFADYRKFLFPGASRPCFIATFGGNGQNSAADQIEYVVPKVRQEDPRSGLVPISTDDRKWIASKNLLAACDRSQASVLWKTYLWGTVRDLRFLDCLATFAPLDEIAGEPNSEKRWIKGHGFKPWYRLYDDDPGKTREKKKIPGKLSDPFVATKDADLQAFVVPGDCIPLGDRLNSVRCKGAPGDTPPEKRKASLSHFYRSPDKRLFQPPLVLINNGFTKFAFADASILADESATGMVFYQDSLTGICGARDDESLLRFFTAYARSKLAAYFLFHTASSWGTERDRVLVHELLRLPFPLPGSPHVSPRAAEIVEEVASHMKDAQRFVANLYENAKQEAEGKADYQLKAKSVEQSRKGKVESLQAALEPLVYEYFDLSEQEKMLVEDTYSVYEPSSTPSSPTSKIATLQTTKLEDRYVYSDLLCNILNEWSRIDQPKGKNQPFHFYAECATMPETGMVLVSIKKAAKKTEPRETTYDGQLAKVVDQLAKVTTSKQGAFAYLRGIIFGDRGADAIRILKPDLLGNWTRSSALNDADTVFHAINQSKTVRK